MHKVVVIVVILEDLVFVVSIVNSGEENARFFPCVYEVFVVYC